MRGLANRAPRARVPWFAGLHAGRKVSTLSEISVGIAASLSDHDAPNEGKGHLGFVRHHCYFAFLGVWPFSSTGAIIAHALAPLSPQFLPCLLRRTTTVDANARCWR